MTPSLLQACAAFQETYAKALRDRPEDLAMLDDLDEAIHQARATVGEAACFAINALSYIATIYTLLTIRPTPPSST